MTTGYKQNSARKIRWPSWAIAFALLFGMVCAARTQSDDLRRQLGSLQKETGLALAYFGWYVGTLDFSRKNKLLSAEDLPRPAGNSQNGDVSPRGDLIAFAWSYGIAVESPTPTGLDPAVYRLAIVQRDGTGLREFPAVKQPDGFCWSPDESMLAVHTRSLSKETSSSGKLLLVDIRSSNVQEVGSGAALLTPQCWSPDGRQIVFEIPELDSPRDRHDGSVELYDLVQKQRSSLARGSYPTWSPGSGVITFVCGDDYYSIDSSGKQKKLLFHAPNARTGLLWSPDSRFIAYGLCCRYKGATTLYRIYVRRLRDNAEDWVADVGDIPHSQSLHWVMPRPHQ